jgi:hypothetical protein
LYFFIPKPNLYLGILQTSVNLNLTKLSIANYLRDYDIIAVQEVVAGYGGVQAVARLADELNRTGTKWDYIISDPTSSPYKTERYAFIWKTNKLKQIGKAWLEKIPFRN